MLSQSAYFSLLAAALPPPPAPTHLVLAPAADSRNQVQLSWTDNTFGVTVHRVEYSTDNFVTPGVEVAVTNIQTYTHTAPTLTAERHYYRVLAIGNPIGATANIAGVLLNMRMQWSLDFSSWSDSIGAYALTGNGGITTALGKVGNGAACVSATGRYLNLASNSLIQSGDTTWALGMWVKLSSLAGYPALASKRSLGNPGWILFLNSATGQVGFQTGATILYNSTTIAVDMWYYVVMAHDAATDTKTLSINAVASTASTGGAAPPTNSAALMLGKDGEDGAANLDGIIDEPSWWFGRVPTSGQIDSIYNAGIGNFYPYPAGVLPSPTNLTLTPPSAFLYQVQVEWDEDVPFSVNTQVEYSVDNFVTQGIPIGLTNTQSYLHLLPIMGAVRYYYRIRLVSFVGVSEWVSTSIHHFRLQCQGDWSFDTTSWTDAVAGNNFTGYNGITIEPGIVGNAARMTMNEQRYLARNANAGLATSGSFSFSFWLYTHSLAGYNELLEWRSSGNWVLYAFAGSWRMHGSNVFDFAQIPSTGTWQHFYMDYDHVASTMSLCIDNGAMSTISVGTPAICASSGPIYIGRYDAANASFSDARLDNMRFMGRTLSVAQRTDDFANKPAHPYP